MSLLSEKLAPIWSAINRLQTRQMSIFPATVTSVDPVRIRIDGEAQSLAATPDNGLPVGQGERVRVLRYGTTHLIIARMNARRQAFAQAAGTVSVPIGDSSGGFTDFPLPAGRFTVPPIMTAVPSTFSGQALGVTLRIVARSASLFGVYAYDTDNRGGATTTIAWHAIQMTPTSAEG